MWAATCVASGVPLVKTAVVMKRVYSSLGLITLCWLIGSCGEGPTAPPAPTTAVVVLSATSGTLVPAASLQLSATAQDQSGQALSRSFAWSSSDIAKATVSSSGLVSGVAAGAATITAAVDGKSATATVTVLDGGVVSSSGATLNLQSGGVQIIFPADALPAPTNVSIVPSTAFANDPRVVKGTPFDFGPSGTKFAKPVTIKIRYDPANLPQGTEEAALQLHLSTTSGWQPIQGSIVDLAAKVVSAEVSHFSVYAILTPLPVAAVTIRAPPDTSILNGKVSSLVVGDSEQLTATLTDSQGGILSNRVVTWATSDATIASVTSGGLVAAINPGTTAVSASAGGVTSSITVIVTPVPVAAVAVTLSSQAVQVGQTSQASAAITDAVGHVLTGRAVTWSSDNNSIASVSTSGVVTALAPGTAQITAASEGKIGSATITVSAIPVASVTVTPVSASVVTGATQQLEAVTKDANGKALTGRLVTWTSSNGLAATVDASGLVTAVGAGSSTITATSEGKTGTSAITVTLVPVNTVTVLPATASLVVGGTPQTQQLTATLRDAATNVLTGRLVTWTSSNGLAATVDASGLVTAVGAGSTTITATSEGKTGTSAITVTAPPSIASLLHRSTQNPRYFENASGQVVYLTGSHTWSNLQDNGTVDPPPTFNYTTYLDFLTSHNHNFFRLWAWEQAKWTAEIAADYWISPGPYKRIGPALALDGKPQFDLTQLDQAYFDRIRQRVIDAGSRGIYVSVMLFDGWSVATKSTFTLNNPWKGHPFNAANNINGINGDTNNDGLGLEVQTLGNSTITGFQEAYVRKVIDAVSDLDNVLYEIDNEGDPTSKDWQYHMIQVIRDYETIKGKHHPIGMTPMWPGGVDTDLTASGADWISITGTPDAPITADGTKVLISDTDHLCGICGDVSWVWKSFTKGHNPILMDGYDGAAIGLGAAGYTASDPKWEAIRKNMGYALSYAQRMDLAGAVPHGDLVAAVATGYCLAKPGSQYLLFIPGGGSQTLDLSAATGSLNVEWFNPATGVATQAGTVPGGPSRTFTPPFSGDAVLFLH